MFITDNVNVPTELIRAQEEGRLVVFAGAGVSMASPSNIPGFVDLAKAVAKRYKQKYYARQQRVQPPDVFLGSLNPKREEEGVHEIVRQIMSEESSKPSELHRLIPLLFKGPHDRRSLRPTTTPTFSQPSGSTKTDMRVLKPSELPHFQEATISGESSICTET
jgi:hypothetical protein